ncbi:SPW repeat protein [Halorussus gelatinilyticus]|uniref:SPW repeat protein n=1 Tax=Halorussus gelatinilyticus TaxID=2937524 RepID=A0A8U0ILH3_9EURY|nr:SPW repeat protein [Halorussus gelatinilyticus]UPW01192.1 SPW repeat protein [Halorussus gelatinilyticus]
MSENTATNRNGSTGGYVSAATALVGGWIVLSAFLYSPPAANFWNDIIVGAAIGVIAGYNAVRADDRESVNTGAASLVALLGLWMVVAPFVFETAFEGAFWSDVVSGALVAVLAGYNVYQSRGTERRTRTAEAETR